MSRYFKPFKRKVFEHSDSEVEMNDTDMLTEQLYGDARHLKGIWMVGCMFSVSLMMMTVQNVLMLMQSAKVLEVVEEEMADKTVEEKVLL